MYYFLDHIINIKDFDPNNVKIDEKSYKDILIYYIPYVTIEHSKIWSMYLHTVFL